MLNWETEAVYNDADEFIAHFEDDIRAAKVSIDIQSYIFKYDRVGKRILELLQEAASRGVLVRMMVDGVGAPFWNAKTVIEWLHKGIYVRIYRALPWQLMSWKGPLWKKIGKFFEALFKRLERLSRRNHRKIWVIDGKIAFVGGINLCEADWRDSGVRVTGPAVDVLAPSFETLWANDSPRTQNRRRHRTSLATYAHQSLVRLNDTRKERRALYHDFIHRILKAKKRVWLTTPYLVPEPSLLKALRLTAWRGVDCRLIVPHKIDIRFMKWVNRSFYDVLVRSGVQVFEYQPRILHSKTSLIDDWATVGSTNLNQRSLFSDLEVDIVLKEPESIRVLEEHFLIDQGVSERKTSHVHPWQLILGRIILVFKRWL